MKPPHDGPNVIDLAQSQKAALSKAEGALPDALRLTKVLAQYRRTAYLAYIEAGFSHEDALVLCTK